MPRSRRGFEVYCALLALPVFLYGCGGDSGTAPVGGNDTPDPPADPDAVGSVGPSGGTLSGDGGKVGLEIPSGAVPSNTTITVKKVETPPTDPNLAAGTMYDFGPDGLQFSTEVTLSIQYDPANIPGHGRAEGLRIFKRVGSGWQPTSNATVNPSTGTVSGDITSFSEYAVLADLCITWNLGDFVPGLNGTESFSVEYSRDCVYDEGPEGIQTRYTLSVTADQVDSDGLAYLKIDAEADAMDEQWVLYDGDWNTLALQYEEAQDFGYATLGEGDYNFVVTSLTGEEVSDFDVTFETLSGPPANDGCSSPYFYAIRPGFETEQTIMGTDCVLPPEDTGLDETIWSDQYMMYLAAGETVTIQSVSTEFNPVTVLFAGLERVAGHETDGNNAYFTYTATESRLHYVMVNSWPFRTPGDYRIRVLPGAVASPCAPEGTVALEGSVSGFHDKWSCISATPTNSAWGGFSVPVVRDFYEFTLTEQTRVLLRGFAGALGLPVSEVFSRSVDGEARQVSESKIAGLRVTEPGGTAETRVLLPAGTYVVAGGSAGPDPTTLPVTGPYDLEAYAVAEDNQGLGCLADTYFIARGISTEQALADGDCAITGISGTEILLDHYTLRSSAGGTVNYTLEVLEPGLSLGLVVWRSGQYDEFVHDGGFGTSLSGSFSLPSDVGWAEINVRSLAPGGTAPPQGSYRLTVN